MIRWQKRNTFVSGIVQGDPHYAIVTLTGHNKHLVPQIWRKEWVPIANKCETLAQAKRVCEMYEATGANGD